ncbi:hypothetical protein NKJ71_25650 [Mesorhizobium sp. M0050]|uniref:hypothetical protein n=1 Tax=Mesorhizobium sp. M0050 TaxID=2956861 RepID=UPI00333A1164
MTDCLYTTKLSRRSILGGLAAISTAGAGVTLAAPQDPLEYHLAEAAKLLSARDPTFGQWDIAHFKGSRSRLQTVTLSAWRGDT